ncbi:MAG: GNAT family N-acetyltransferase [Tannerella sp.]|jgi:predicted acetyltransferase|nr:GNAT family N-acetyltransferase [Tannerella sp.]
MKEQIMELWKQSFGDTDDYIRLFFERAYRDDQTLVFKQNGRIVSALQILPYEMSYCGTTLTAGYICGVCTLSSERGKGLMSRLMIQALEEMGNHNFAIAVIIPASTSLFDLYRRFDFANAFDYSLEEIQSGNEPFQPRPDVNVVSHDILPPDAIYAYYRQKQHERQCSILHADFQFETIRQERILGGGEIWAAITNTKIAGLAFTDPVRNNTLSIREIMCDHEEIKFELVQAILDHHRLKKGTLRLPPSLPNSIPYGMAKIINKKQMIERFRTFHAPTLLPDFYNFDVISLTQTLLKYDQRQAQMNLMLD